MSDNPELMRYIQGNKLYILILQFVDIKKPGI